MKHEKDKGRKIILVTGAHTSIAMAIGNIFNIFDEIHGTDEINLVGKNKANFLIDRYGLNGFGTQEIPRQTFMYGQRQNQQLQSTRKSLISKINKLQPSSTNTDFSNSNIKISVYIKTLLTAMRIKQWIKNSLIFVPLILSQSFASLESVFTSLIAFLAFSCCASSVYLLNDLIDLENDRQHVYKKFRPFASGTIRLIDGILIALVLLMISFTLAIWVNINFLFILITYYLITFSYSFKLKKMILIDIFTLAVLYTFRLIAGGSAIEINLSNWILMFSFFIFMSLGTLKRFIDVDLDNIAGRDRKEIISAGRGYTIADLTPLVVLGFASGLISVLVFLFYVSDPSVISQYRSPQFLWFASIALAYWIANLWFLASRNLITEDPISFALKEKTSLVTIIILVTLFLLAIFI